MKEGLELVKFILRRERVSFVIWVVCIVGLVVYTASVYPNMYPTEVERYAAMLLMENPAIIAIVGPSTGAYSIGALFVQETLLITLIAVGIMNILLVNRYTRVDEELGRLELIRSFPVESSSVLQALFVVVLVVNGLIGVLTTIGVATGGMSDMPFAGSLLFGVVIFVAGLLFASVSAVYAQLLSTARGVAGWSFMTLLIMYLVRAIGDINGNFLSYISPLGLLLQTSVYVNDVWWPVVVVAACSFCIAISAFVLIGHRDLGAGLIPAKAGPAHGAKSLLSVGGLAWRMQRGSLIIWVIGAVAMGFVFGAVVGEIEGYIGENETMQAFLALESNGEVSLTEQFIPFLIVFLVITLLIPIIGPILKLAGEERRHLSELILARSVSRSQLLGSYLLISMFSSVCLLMVGGFGFWLGGVLLLEEAIAYSTLMSAMAVYLPAAWILIGISVFLLGWLPRLMSLATLMIGYVFFIVFFSDLLSLPQFLVNLSPLEHVPNVPVDEFSFIVFLIMSGIAAILIVAGFIGYGKRDIQGS